MKEFPREKINAAYLYVVTLCSPRHRKLPGEKEDYTREELATLFNWSRRVGDFHIKHSFSHVYQNGKNVPIVPIEDCIDFVRARRSDYMNDCKKIFLEGLLGTEPLLGILGCNASVFYESCIRRGMPSINISTGKKARRRFPRITTIEFMERYVSPIVVQRTRESVPF